MDKTKVDKIVCNMKATMRFEGFDIPEKLEGECRKILAGELDADAVVNRYAQEAREWSLQNA